MCGIVGTAGDLAYRDEALMKKLLIIDYFRGNDSTGLAAVRNTGEIHVAKVPSNPIDLFDMGKFKTTLNGNMSKAFIGHNRAATRGLINHANTHPFEVDHIVGAHNGTLDTASIKRLEDELGEMFAVDSLALITGIAKLGLKKTIALLSPESSWSIVYYDSKENTLNFLRNKERPMWYAFSKNFNQIFWASEWEFIDAAIKLSVGYELATEGERAFCYFPTDENVHYAFDLDVFKGGCTKKPKAKAKTVKGREAPVPAAAVLGYDPFTRREGTLHQNGPSNKRSSKTTSGTSGGGTTSGNIVHLMGDLGEPLAGYISKEAFEDLARHGCGWCREPVYYGDTGLVIYERHDLVFCRECGWGDDKEHNTRIFTKPNHQVLTAINI